MKLMMLAGLSFLGAAAAAGDSSGLKHQEQSFSIRLNGAATDVAPLFGPVREAEWAHGWTPDFIYPSTPTQVEGAVFTTSSADGQRIWVLAVFDVDAGRVEYVVVSPGLTATQINIAIVPAGTDRSKVVVTYRRTALSPEGNSGVEQLNETWAEEQRRHWETAINQTLSKHEKK